LRRARLEHLSARHLTIFFALLVSNCRGPLAADTRPQPVPSAAATPTIAGDADAPVDAAVADVPPARDDIGVLAWDERGKVLVYLRQRALHFVETERYTLLRKIDIGAFGIWGGLYPLERGGALLVVGEATDARSKGDPLIKALIISANGDVVTEKLGAERTFGTEQYGDIARIPAALINEAGDTFTRILVEGSSETKGPSRSAVEVRSLRDGKLKTRTRLPSWFRGPSERPPYAIDCKGALCAFAVASQGTKEPASEREANKLLAIFDGEERTAKLVPSVLLGQLPSVAFGTKRSIAVSAGGGTDPLLVDARTLAVRPFGRRPKKNESPGPTSCLAFSRDGSLLASAAAGDGLALFDTATGKRRWQAMTVANDHDCGVTFAANGNVLDYSAIGNIQEIDVTTGAKVAEARLARKREGGPPTSGPDEWLTFARLSASGAFFLVLDREHGSDVVVDTRSWKTEPFKATGFFAPSERSYVVGGRVFSMETRKPIATLP
jgi:hypothetical protein